jgi:hypothetical protein
MHVASMPAPATEPRALRAARRLLPEASALEGLLLRSSPGEGPKRATLRAAHRCRYGRIARRAEVETRRPIAFATRTNGRAGRRGSLLDRCVKHLIE